MIELAAFLVLVFSLGGMFFIYFKKAPFISILPSVENEDFFSRLKKRINKINPFKKFSLEIFLQKVLSKIRILALKIDNLTFKWLKELRQRYQTRKKEKKDSYWEEIKKIKED